MPRYRSRDGGLLNDMFEFLVAVPWWMGPIVAGVAYSFFEWFTPWMLSDPDPEERARQAFSTTATVLSHQAAPIVAGIVLFVWLMALLKKLINVRRLDTQTGIETIRQLRWDEFEELLAEAFRRQGYRVQLMGGSRPDGGIDVALERNGEVTLVQCKHWCANKVPVRVVRELLGSIADARAHRGIVVTSGRFTRDAIEFGAKNRIQLIDGPKLEELIRSVQKTSKSTVESGVEKPDIADVPLCPKCNATMVIQTAKRGKNAGSRFWGCSRFPNCRGIRELRVTAV